MLNRRILTVGLALVLFTGFFNPGIIAIDDYNNGFAEMIPAQNARPFSTVLQSGIHPVLPRAIFSTFTRIALAIGLTDPFSQLRFALVLIGLLCFGLNISATRRLFAADIDSGALTLAYFLVGCHFAMPLFSTRPMIETLAMPFLTWSAVVAGDYANRGNRASLIGATALLALASLLRFQSGICGVALFFLVLYRRRWYDAALLTVSAVALFFLTGLLDYFVQGRFHGQLFAYVVYCLKAGEIFGKMPFYVFLLLAVALSLPPTFLARYPGFAWQKAYRPLLAPLLYFAVFLTSHTISPHKEERFLVPVLPLLLFLLVPAARYLWKRGATWRRYWFLGANGILLILACTNVPQRNLIGLASWLTLHPSVERVDSIDRALVLRPQAFLLRPIAWSDAEPATYASQDCGKVAIVRWDAALDDDWDRRFREVARFEPAPLEMLLVRVNRNNARRGPLRAYLPIGCPSPPAIF